MRETHGTGIGIRASTEDGIAGDGGAAIATWSGESDGGRGIASGGGADSGSAGDGGGNTWHHTSSTTLPSGINR